MTHFLQHSQGPWEKHKYVKIIDGQYYYPDSYEGGRHLPDGKAATAGTSGANVGKKTVTAKKTSSSSSSSKKTTSSSKSSESTSNSPTIEVRKNLGLYTKSKLRKRSGKTISELEKLLSDSKREQSEFEKKRAERLKKAVKKSSSTKVSSVKNETPTEVKKAVEKVSTQTVKKDPDLGKIYSVYKKRRKNSK